MPRAITIAAIAVTWAQATGAQELDLTITDPAEIAAVCGGDAGKGEGLFAVRCAACHSLDADLPVTLSGPHLFGMFGRGAGTLQGHTFSRTLAVAGENGVVWEQAPLHRFLRGETLWSPEHPTIAEDQEMFDILTYLRTATLPPPPKPGEVEVPEAVLAMKGDAPYGEYLASECAGCHTANNDSIPQIVSMDKVEFVTALFEYRARARTNDKMQNVAGRLGDEEIVALAAYFTR